MTEQARPSIRLSTRTYAIGDVLVGKYVLEKTLGEGGMGTVWLARNVTLDAPVAVKLIRPELDLDEASDRLLKEARATAKIEHRAIVRVFDFGETEEGVPFIVMELLDGRSLGDVIDEQGKLPPIEVVQTLLPVLDGLARAHQEGVVHRDLKPSNIFLAREGKRTQPKVVDFGIAKLDRYDTSPKLTRQGTVLGSPSYMAPEQARGLDDVDHRADVWTASVVLYEAVTGSAAFEGANYNAVLRGVIEDDPRPMSDFGVHEPELAAIVARGLAKDRDERYATITDLGDALARWLTLRGVLADICGDSIDENWQVDLGEREIFENDLPPLSDPFSAQPSSDALLLVKRRTPDRVSPEESIPPSSPFEEAPQPTRKKSGLSFAGAVLLGLALFAGAFGAVRELRAARFGGLVRIPSALRISAPATPATLAHDRSGPAADETYPARTEAKDDASGPARLRSKKEAHRSSATPSVAAQPSDLKEPY